jgi:hypothetical protein
METTGTMPTAAENERSSRAQLASHVRWAREPDRLKATEPGRRAARDRFLTQAKALHPDASPAFLRKVAKNLAAEHQIRMTRAAAAARKAKKAGARRAAQRARKPESNGGEP